MTKKSMPKIAVIGRGVIGLTTAELLLDSGYKVDIISKDDMPNTSSMGAGAYWWPHKAYPRDQVAKWSAFSYNKYRDIVKIPESGIKMHTHFRYCVKDDETRYALEITDKWSMIEQDDVNFEITEAFQCVVPLIDVPVYMPWLLNNVLDKGAELKVIDLASISDVPTGYDIVVNCSGLGAKTLVNDASVFPIRGQIVRLERPAHINNSYRVVHEPPGLTLILPRSGDLLLGGTTSNSNFNTDPSDDETQEIIDRCSKVIPELKKLKVLGSQAALRPGRDTVSLEAELLDDGKVLIHNYGHGGSGYTIGYGCANDVLQIVENL